MWHSTDPKYRRVIYRCNAKYNNEERCHTPHLTEEQIKQMFIFAVNRLIAGREDIIATLRRTSASVFDTSALEAERDRLAVELNLLAEKMQAAIAENARVALDQTEYEKRYDELARRYDIIKAEHDALSAQIADKASAKVATQQFISTLRKLDHPIQEFNPDLWGTLLDHVTVHAEDDIRFIFRDGTEIQV